MNLDFHYYGTYFAARCAGYGNDEALTIAKAAQYVDEMSVGETDKHGGIPTIQTPWELKSNPATDFTAEDLKTIKNIWVPFHFLPGNFDCTVQYKGPIKHTGEYFHETWENNDTAKAEFRLMCLPNSELVFHMIKHLQNLDHCKQKLHHIGLCMHVLADTWAHQYFAGLPAWHINDAGDTVSELPDPVTNPERKNKLIWGKKDNLAENSFFSTPPGPRYNSTVYLGHGRMGHLPDYACMTYEYQPMWKQAADIKTLTKNNPGDHFKAFAQMVNVMTCIKSGQQLDVRTFENGTANLAPSVENGVRTVLSTRALSQNDDWKKLIAQERSGEQVPDFKAQEWQDDRSQFISFMEAASIHKGMVKAFLTTKGINLDSENLM